MSDFQEKLKETWWPNIESTESAQKAARQGTVAACFCAGATLLVVILNEMKVFDEPLLNADKGALIDVVCMLGVAIGTWWLSRTAAVFGLLLYWSGQVVALQETGRTNFTMVILLSMMFLNSVRGTFAYHRTHDDHF